MKFVHAVQTLLATAATTPMMNPHQILVWHAHSSRSPFHAIHHNPFSILQTAKPESQYRLRCQLAASAAADPPPVRGTVVANGEAAKVHPELARAQTLDNIAKKVRKDDEQPQSIAKIA